MGPGCAHPKEVSGRREAGSAGRRPLQLEGVVLAPRALLMWELRYLDSSRASLGVGTKCLRMRMPESQAEPLERETGGAGTPGARTDGCFLSRTGCPSGPVCKTWLCTVGAEGAEARAAGPVLGP